MGAIFHRIDPLVKEISWSQVWGRFLRACSLAGLYFDHHIERSREDRLYRVRTQELVSDKPPIVMRVLSEGSGATPVEAFAAAYRSCGRSVPAAEPHLELLTNPPADSFDGLFGATTAISSPAPAFDDLFAEPVDSAFEDLFA